MSNVAPMAMAMPQMAYGMPQMQLQAAAPPMAAYGMPQLQGPTGPTMALPLGATAGPRMGLPMAAGVAPTIVTPQMGMPMPGTMAPATSQGVLGAEGMNPPSSMRTILKSALVTGGLGAALGFGATFLPFVPNVRLMAALIGGAAGALIGVVRGIKKANLEKEQFQSIQGSAMQPADPGTLGPPLPVAATRKSKSARRKARAGSHIRIVVKSGDTLGEIAHRHSTTVKALHAANKESIGADPNHLKVGTKLIVPAKRPAK